MHLFMNGTDESKRTANVMSTSMQEVSDKKRLKREIQTAHFCLKHSWQDVKNRRQATEKILTSHTKSKQRLVCMAHNTEQHDIKKESFSDL